MFKLLYLFILFAGCAHAPDKLISDYKQANMIEEPDPAALSVPVVKRLDKEISIENQIRKIEQNKPTKKYSTPAVIDMANKRAALKPTSDKFFNAITVYDYLPGVLYQVYSSPSHITDIMLQEGEELTTEPGAGDTLRWKIGTTTSGIGRKKRTHILIKPTTPKLHTNLIITTTKHVYHLEIQSYKKTYMSAISWNYPEDEFNIMQSRNIYRKKRAAQVIGNIAIADLDFNYQIEGNAKWKPIRVFNDGKKTYVKFPDSVKFAEIPPLFILSQSNKAQIVNYRYKNNYYIVDRLFDAAVLQIGEIKQEKVFIFKNKQKNHPAITSRYLSNLQKRRNSCR